MYLVRSILKALENGSSTYSESEIKKVVGKARKDYGTTNNTLRRLCEHGVLTRRVGVCRSTRRPSWLYSVNMSKYGIESYLEAKDKQIARAKQKRLGNDKLFCFSTEHELTTGWREGQPLMIGVGLAPEGMEYKCLIVHGGYEMQITEDEAGRKIISFKKKD